MKLTEEKEQGAPLTPGLDLRLGAEKLTPLSSGYEHFSTIKEEEVATLKLGGAELKHPTIVALSKELAKDSSKINLVDGGSTGKTEMACTALAAQAKNAVCFDLRTWTIKQVSELLQTEVYPGEEVNQEVALLVRELSNEHGVNPDLKRLYATDSRFKRIERLLLEDSLDSIKEELEAKNPDVVILDEFDLCQQKVPLEDEIASAKMLLELLSKSEVAHSLTITHPPSQGSIVFTDLISQHLAESKRLTTRYFPRDLALEALKQAGIAGAEAGLFRDKCRGLPLAYLPLAINKNGILDQKPSVQELLDKTEKKIQKLSNLIIDRLQPETKEYLYNIAAGTCDPDSLSGALQEQLLDTTFLFRKDGGALVMTEIVKDALRKLEEQVLQKAGENLLSQLPLEGITVLPTTQSVKIEELREKFPEGPVVTTDFAIDNIHYGQEYSYGFRKEGIISVDHHAPVESMQKFISSANLAMLYVEENGPVPADTPVVINHTDCDSVLSALILRGILAPEAAFGRAAIAADHTGGANDIGDLLNPLEAKHDLNLSAEELAKLLLGITRDEKQRQFASEQIQIKKAVETGFTQDGPLACGIVADDLIDAGKIAAYFPEATLVAVAIPQERKAGETGPQRYVVRRRLGAGAEDFTLLDIKEFDPNYGGRWNAGSNRRGGGTILNPEEYFSKLRAALPATVR